jgi:DNA-binding transcriptional ArsR family regulator
MRRCYKFSETWKPPARFGARIPMISLIQMLAVAEYLNFYHAANALGVSQSTVSARIRTLEEDLGILLFKRQASGVRLTEAGRHLVEGIAAGIDHIEHAVKTAGAFAQCDLDRIHVGIDAPSSDPDPANWCMLRAIFSGILNPMEGGCHEAEKVFGRADCLCVEAG